MRKVPTLFLRDPADMRRLTREMHPLPASWFGSPVAVIHATRKFDGVCHGLTTSGRWLARREVKPGKTAPPNFEALETDPETGKTVGWEPVEQSAFFKAFRAVSDLPGTPGTYELCGPTVNKNPECFDDHVLVPHGQFRLYDVPTGYDELAEYLADLYYEGVVWHGYGFGPIAKIKRRDFVHRLDEIDCDRCLPGQHGERIAAHTPAEGPCGHVQPEPTAEPWYVQAALGRAVTPPWRTP